MRIATYNVEWFTNLFDDLDRPIFDDRTNGTRRVPRRRQLDALGRVFKALDADVILVVEAPDTNARRRSTRALANFARHFGLRTSAAVAGFASDTEQELTVLFDPDRVQARHDPGGMTPRDGMAVRFDRALRVGLLPGAVDELVTFSKPPIELALTIKDGKVLRLIGVHIKSKAPHGARTPDEVRRLSIENRRKSLGQAIWLRHRVDEVLAKGEPLIVLGDFNDGPGQDDYEALFGRSSVEIVLGDGTTPRLREAHAEWRDGQAGPAPTSARFFIEFDQRNLDALLDYVMVSPDLAKGAAWGILHPEAHPLALGDPSLAAALFDASDHFPVYVDILL